MSGLNHRTKLFQPDNNGPDERLVVESHPDTEKAELFHQVRTEDGWETTGLIELFHGPRFERGTFDEPMPVMQWMWTRFHASGDRVKVEHRITSEKDTEGVTLTHEKRRVQVLGPPRREEHDWRPIEAWRVTAAGIEDLEVGPDE